MPWPRLKTWPVLPGPKLSSTFFASTAMTSGVENKTLGSRLPCKATRAPTQGFVDRFAAIYTPARFVIALAVALLSPWLLGWTWMQAIYKALVLLVIACPCALVISTPVTIVSGLAAAARRGILIKGGVYLEEARKLRAIALDKTGTITENKMSLAQLFVQATGETLAPDTCSSTEARRVIEVAMWASEPVPFESVR